MSTTLSSVTTAEFDAVVVESDIPVLVDFWAEWCGPCKAMLPTLEEVAETYAGEVKVVKVDIEANPSLAERFNTRTIPLFVLFKDGSEKSRAIGAMSKTRLCGFIDANVEAAQ